MDQSTGFSTGRYRRSILAATLLAPALFLLAAWPLIFLKMDRGRAAIDSLNFHEKAIRTFARELPSPELHDYLSATTPGYHLAVATFSRLVSDQRLHLQLFGSLFTVGLIATLASACAWRMRRAISVFGVVAVCLPLITSLYIMGSGVWLLPDNAGWWALLCIMLLALRRSQHFGVWVIAGALMVLLVLMRQIHLWAAGLVWVGAWMGAGPARSDTPLFARQDTGGLMVPRIARALVAGLLTLPAFFVLYAFIKMWGGLTPPTFKDMHGASIQWAAPAFDLALLAIAGIFYAAFWSGALAKLAREQAWIILAAAFIGLALAVLPETTESQSAGRVTALFHAVKALPVIAGHTSILFLLLSPLGAVVLVAWLRAMNPRARWIMLAALGGFMLANSANPQLWQRYHEPFILLWTILSSSLAVWSAGGISLTPRARFFMVAGPLLLAGLLAAISYRGIFDAPPAADAGYSPGNFHPGEESAPR